MIDRAPATTQEMREISAKHGASYWLVSTDKATGAMKGYVGVYASPDKAEQAQQFFYERGMTDTASVKRNGAIQYVGIYGVAQRANFEDWDGFSAFVRPTISADQTHFLPPVKDDASWKKSVCTDPTPTGGRKR